MYYVSMRQKDVLGNTFESSELVYIERSRRSNNMEISVVDHRDVIDLKVVLKNSKAVDFNKRLSLEENKNRRIEQRIDFG